VAGPVWPASGASDRNSHKDQTFANRLEYIKLNPVRKGLVGAVWNVIDPA